MENIRLIVREDTFCVGSSSKSSFTGEIYFELAGQFFPSKGWNDLIPGVLHMWTDNLIALLGGEPQDHQLNFMDGPYKILIALDKKNLQLTFLEEKYDPETDEESNTELYRNKILVSDFIEQICNAVQVTISFAKSNAITYRSVSVLERNLETLNRHL